MKENRFASRSIFILSDNSFLTFDEASLLWIRLIERGLQFPAVGKDFY